MEQQRTASSFTSVDWSSWKEKINLSGYAGWLQSTKLSQNK